MKDDSPFSGDNLENTIKMVFGTLIILFALLVLCEIIRQDREISKNDLSTQKNKIL